MKTIKLDIVSDVVCPWCAIGYKRLERAMETLGEELRFEIDWHPFELNPQMAPEGENASEHLMRKYSLNPEQLEANRARIAGIGQELGIEFGSGGERRIFNTFDAHRVLYWARLQGQQTAFNLALFQEYFTDGHDPADPAVLRRVAESLGLDGAEVDAILSSDRYAKEVRTEEQRYLDAGIHSVPAYIVNGKYLISGGQEPATFVSAFRQIAAEGA